MNKMNIQRQLNIITQTSAGIHGIDANETSPARVPGVLTVGVININDAKTNFSNYGSVVDIFAPGENIVSAGIFGGPAVSI
jgi:subtilisin family serine protease